MTDIPRAIQNADFVSIVVDSSVVLRSICSAHFDTRNHSEIPSLGSTGFRLSERFPVEITGWYRITDVCSIMVIGIHFRCSSRRAGSPSSTAIATSEVPRVRAPRHSACSACRRFSTIWVDGRAELECGGESRDNPREQQSLIHVPIGRAKESERERGVDDRHEGPNPHRSQRITEDVEYDGRCCYCT